AAAHRHRREQPVQVLVGHSAAVLTLAGELAAIVLRQCAGIRLERLYADAITHRWAAAPHLGDQLVDGAQFLECRPIGVALAPAGSRLQPDGERLREVLSRVRLRVPLSQMMHVAAAARSGLVPRGILERGGTEDLAPALAAAEPIRVVERMPCFVAQDA